MSDRIYENFLRRQWEDGMHLAADSDLLALVPVEGVPPSRYLAVLGCRGLVAEAPGRIVVTEQFAVALWFPSDYLRRANPFQVVSWVAPRSVFHPNIGPMPVTDADPMGICLGPVTQGTPLVELLYRVHALVTYQRVTMREDDALNRDACRWARANQHRFPIDDRPLKRSRTVGVFAPVEVGR